MVKQAFALTRGWYVFKTIRATALLVLGSLVLLPAPVEAGQYVEIKAEVSIVGWHFKDAIGRLIETSNSFHTQCIVWTNTWWIEHDHSRNAKTTFWFIGTNILKRTIITKDLSKEKAENELPSPMLGTIPPVGTRYMTRYNSLDGIPVDDLGDNLPWLAFCSGIYLKLQGREVPMPGANIRREAFDYRDKTTVFKDNFGLPKSIEFLTAANQLKGQYQVQRSTNFMGWNFPLEFTLIRYRQDDGGKWVKHMAATGKVTSIREANKPEVPEEDLKELQPRKQQFQFQ
jgi:hypothetical protein